MIKSGYTAEDLARLGPDELTRKRLLAEALMKENSQKTIRHPLEGAAQMANALIGGLQMRKLDKAGEIREGNTKAANSALLDSLFSSGQSSGFTPSPSASPASSGGMAMAPTPQNQPPIPGIQAQQRSSALPGSFLAAVDRTEGAGGYDTLYGHAQKNAFAGTDVSKMPIADVLAFTDPSGAYAQSVKGQIGRVATPVGRYQVVGTTLRKAVDALGLDPSQPFDANTQDQVAAYLATQRIKSAGSLPEKISALRSEWHGFNNVPDSEMAQIVADLESGGSGSLGAVNAMGQGGSLTGYVDPMVVNPNSRTAPVEVAQAGPPKRGIVDALMGGSNAPAQMSPDYFPPAPSPVPGGQQRALIERLLGNPETREMGQSLLLQEMERQQQASDPLRQLELRKKQQELQTGAPDYISPLEQQKLGMAKEELDLKRSQAATTDDIKEYEYAKKHNGYTGTLDEFILSQKKASANSTTNIVGGEGDKFYENLDKKNAETFAAMSDSGMQARAKIAQIDRLEGLMGNAPQGALGALKQAAGEWGIATEGLSDIQAASALLEKMVPEQRAPGTGPMSDADIKMFRASLPRVLNQPGGNELIFQTMRGIAQYEMQMGEIADQVADRVITPAEGRRLIRELKNPLADFKVPAGPTPNAGRRTTTGVQWSID